MDHRVLAAPPHSHPLSSATHSIMQHAIVTWLHMCALKGALDRWAAACRQFQQTEAADSSISPASPWRRRVPGRGWGELQAHSGSGSRRQTKQQDIPISAVLV